MPGHDLDPSHGACEDAIRVSRAAHGLLPWEPHRLHRQRQRAVTEPELSAVEVLERVLEGWDEYRDPFAFIEEEDVRRCVLREDAPS